MPVLADAKADPEAAKTAVEINPTTIFLFIKYHLLYYLY